MSIKINNQDIVAINKGEQSIAYVYKGIDLIWQLNADPLDKSIYFADPEVGRVLYAKGLIANPIKSSKRELATITSLNPDGDWVTGYFYNNKVITKFPELQYCTGLTDLISAFYGCENLTEVGNIPDSVTDMSYTFYECSSLDGVFVIKPINPPTYVDTFYRSTNVRAIYVPDESVSIYKTALGWSSHRYRIYPMSDMEDHIVFKDPEVARVLFINGLIVDSNISSIDELASITSLNPGGGGNTSYFSNNTVITKFPELQYCTGLTSLYHAFRDCENLTEITIPDSVTDMRYTFYYCRNLVNAPIIPEGVTNMYGTFYNCESLINAPIIPNSVANMRYTFKNCYSLVSAPTIPNSVTSMDSTFKNCRSLVSAPIIPNSVANMDSTFYNCPSLLEAPDIPSSVTNMYGTFYNCTSLINAPIISEGITIMDSTFYDCRNLINAPIIPESVTVMDSTFINCESLVDVPIIPDSVTNMRYTFWRCTSLIKAPIIPGSVTNMEATFGYCSNLDGIFIIKPVTPPTYNYIFSNTNVVTIYVPDGTVYKYKTASGWSDHSDKIKSISELSE